MAEEAVLQMRGICKYFPGVKALQNVDFTLREGEIHALMGENGAGKSTTILVNGLALILCLCYMYKMGWYLSAADVLWIMGDEILIVLLAAHFPALSAFR